MKLEHLLYPTLRLAGFLFFYKISTEEKFWVVLFQSRLAGFLFFYRR